MFGFLKVKKHEARGFNYKPRYFDAEKEALRQKIKSSEMHSQEGDIDDAAVVKSRIRDGLRHAKNVSRRDLKGLWRGGNVRIIAILIALIFFFYIVMNKFLPVIIQMFFPEY
jgi:hypothetical protein